MKISKTILEQVNNLKTGQITNPIQISNGYIILKLEDKRLIKRNIDIDKELKKLIVFEKEKQLNQYSLMYFYRIKKNLFINES